MAQFSLRQLCNTMVQDLNRSVGSKNLIRLNIDTKLPDVYDKKNEFPTDLTDQLVNFLSKNLINGIITIDISKGSQIDQHITLYISITGTGIPEIGVSSQHKSENQLQEEFSSIIETVNQEIIFSPTEENLTISFKVSLLSFLQKEIKSQLIFHNRKVLIAEDNTINAMVFASFLEDWGIDSTVVENGQQAIEIIKSTNDYDLILMDIHMPIINGIEATREIKKLKSKLPVIVLSASNYQQAIQEAMEAGANQFISKPVTSSDLYQALIKFL